jgi:hypothetical protein
MTYHVVVTIREGVIDAEATIATFPTKEEAVANMAEEIMWEGTKTVTILDNDGEVVDGAVGTFT